MVGVASDEIGWNDVGSWNAVYELLPRDAEGNTLAETVLAQAAAATTWTPPASSWRCSASTT